jgi:prepilin-type N-terminal cleavage/methylation domain-containing protein
MNSHRTRRYFKAGFSLIEVLAVIMIIGLLIAILIPAIQQTRATARTAQCANNMRQIGLALHNYHEVHRVLPPGMFNFLGSDINSVTQSDGTVGGRGPTRSCWMQRILPYMDQKALYDQFPLDTQTDAYKWGKLYNVPIWTVVPQFMCPSDPANPKNVTAGKTKPEESEGFHGNVVMCAASTDFGSSDQWKVDGTIAGDKLNGMFYALSSTRFADVSDGLSSTVMGSEFIINQDGNISEKRDTRGRYYNCFRGNCLFSTQFPPNTSVPDESDSCLSNPASPCNTDADVIALYSRSYHRGGVNCIIADGSVRFISNNIFAEVFRALGTRAGREKVSDF